MDRERLLLTAYAKMLRIRLTEEALVQEYLKDNRRSFVHFYIGQEAVAVGVCMNLTKSDLVFSTHRSHGHYIAKGGDLNRMIAELYGKETGCSRGRGGSMHLIDKSVGFMGSISILASVVPIAVGAAYALKKQGKRNIVVVFVGDGAADEGGFYESINLAALMKVPILFVVEDNLYAGMSPREARHPEGYNLMNIARGLGAFYHKVGGNDFIDVYRNVVAIIPLLKTAPGILECKTYRHMAHSAPIFDDKLGYRGEDDFETRLQACPIIRLEKKILNEKIATKAELLMMADAKKHEIKKAFRFTERSPEPRPETLMDGVYYE